MSVILDLKSSQVNIIFLDFIFNLIVILFSSHLLHLIVDIINLFNSCTSIDIAFHLSNVCINTLYPLPETLDKFIDLIELIL